MVVLDEIADLRCLWEAQLEKVEVGNGGGGENSIILTTSVPSQPIKSIWPIALHQHHSVSS